MKRASPIIDSASMEAILPALPGAGVVTVVMFFSLGFRMSIMLGLHSEKVESEKKRLLIHNYPTTLTASHFFILKTTFFL